MAGLFPSLQPASDVFAAEFGDDGFEPDAHRLGDLLAVEHRLAVGVALAPERVELRDLAVGPDHADQAAFFALFQEAIKPC